MRAIAAILFVALLSGSGVHQCRIDQHAARLDAAEQRQRQLERVYVSDRAKAIIVWNETADRIDAVARDADQCHTKAELLRFIVKTKHGPELPSIPEPWPERGARVEQVRRVVGP